MGLEGNAALQSHGAGCATVGLDDQISTGPCCKDKRTVLRQSRALIQLYRATRGVDIISKTGFHPPPAQLIKLHRAARDDLGLRLTWSTINCTTLDGFSSLRPQKFIGNSGGGEFGWIGLEVPPQTGEKHVRAPAVLGT